MDRYGWLKSITQFSAVCVSSTINNQILFFDGHDSHFDDKTLNYMEDQWIQSFALKPVKSGNDHPNENGLNEKLKSLYNSAKLPYIFK